MAADSPESGVLVGGEDDEQERRRGEEGHFFIGEDEELVLVSTDATGFDIGQFQYGEGPTCEIVGAGFLEPDETDSPLVVVVPGGAFPRSIAARPFPPAAGLARPKTVAF